MPNINDLFNQAAQDNQNILSRSDVKYASPDFEQYRFQDNYNNIGFNPFDPAQHKRWEAQETTWTALAKGWDTFKGRFGNTFTDYWADYGRMAEAAFTFDLRKLAPDDADLLRQYNKDQKELMKNYVFAPMGTEDDIFTKKTVSEFIGNAGFALGTFAGMAIELGVDAIITVATEGAGAESFAFTAARIGAKQAGKQAIKGMAKTGARDLVRGMVTVDRAVETAADAGKVAKQIEQIKQVSNIRKFGNAYKQTADEMFKTISFNMKGIMKSKSFGQFFENVAKGVPMLGTGIRYGEHIAQAGKAGASSLYKIGLGIQGVRRIASELNMASTESSFEAASTYGETLDQMIAQHRVDKGTNPTAFELEQMKTLASNAAYSNFKTNLPLLLATNRLQFGSIFNKFPIANKWVNEIAGADTEKILGVNRLFKSSPRIAKGYVKGVFGTWGVLKQVSHDFGKKQAMLLGLKTFGKSVFKFELNEGLQENLQETSAIGWRNYYAGQFNGIQYTLEEAFTKGAEAQLTKQGLKTFLMGAFTGMLIHGPTAAMTGSIEGVQRGITNYKYRNDKENNPYTKAREQQKKDINALNEFFDAIAKDKNLGKLLHFAYQTEKVQEQTQAAANNDQYAFQNAEDDVVLHMAILADKLGMSKAYQTAIREMGSEMTDKEFEEAFGVKLEETKYKSAREFTEKAVKDIKKYTEAVESIRQSASNLINPYLFEGDEQEMAMIMRNAQEDAIHILALNYLKSSRAVERAKSLAHELSQIPEIANSTDYVFRVMKNPEHINSEIGSLVVEIKNLEKSLEGVDAETKAQIEEQINTKKQLVELLHKWKGYYPSKKEKVIVQEEGKESETEQTIYGRFAGKKTQVTNEENKVVDTYDPYDREVFETYRKIVNLKNKEYGYDVTIPDTGLDNAFKKVIDFIQLDRDAKDYMEAYNQIFNPEMYMNLVINMSSGKLKYYVITMLDMINNDIRNLIENTIIYSNETILKGIIEGTLTVKQVSDKVKEIYEETRTKIESLESFKILLVASSTLDWGSQKNVEMYYNTLKTLQNELEPILEEVEAYCKSPNIFDSKEQTDDEKLEALGYSNEDIRIISPEDKENIIKNHIGRETYFAKEEEEEATTIPPSTKTKETDNIDEELTRLINEETIDKRIEAIKQIINDINSKTTALEKRLSKKERTLKYFLEHEADNLSKLRELQIEISELKNKLDTLNIIKKDLDNQIEYYHSLISDKNFKTLDKTEIENKIQKLESKRSTLIKLLEKIRKIIKAGIDLLKSAVLATNEVINELDTFTQENKFFNIKRTKLQYDYKILRNLYSELSDDDFNKQYANLKRQHEVLLQKVNEYLDQIELLENVQTKDKSKEQQLIDNIEKIDRQVRYLQDLIAGNDLISLEKQILNTIQSETTQSNPVQGVPIKSFVRSGENIGSQGINENKLFALAQNIAKELGIDINESNYIAKLKPHLDKVIAFVREHPAHVQRAVNGMYDIEDGNHRANLLRLLGATHIPAIIAQPSAPEEQEPKTFIANGNDVETTSGKTVVTTNSPEEATQLSFDFNQTTLTYDMVVAQYPELTVEQAIKFSEFIDAELKKYNEKYKSKTLKAFFKLKSEKLYKTWSKAQEVNIDETPEEITPEETPEIVYPVDQVEPNSNQKLNSQDIKSFTDKLINFNKSFEMPETNTTFVVKAETDALSKLNSISSCKK